MERRKLIVVAGPTASGKSGLAVALARRIRNAEVISADSRQVYRGMNIGTGKITKREMRGVPHSLLDVASPRRIFTVAEYQKLARKALERVWKHGMFPILCGGTGLYIRAAVDGIAFPNVPPNPALRERLKKISAEKLFTLLKKKDPARARSIDRKNPRRLIRALEITEKLGRVPPLSFSPLDADTLFLGVQKEPDTLKRLIEIRLKKRLKQGMLAEIRRLHEKGVSWKRMEELGLEYRYGSRLLRGKLTQEEFKETLAKEIVAYAKRQMTWFKRDSRIRWVSNINQAIGLADAFLEGGKYLKITSHN